MAEADADDPNDAEEADDSDGTNTDGANDAGTLLGFAHVRYAPEVGTVVLRRIYVHPDAWGVGAGSALPGAVARRFVDDHERLSAVVFSETEVGLSFYLN